MDYDTIKDKLTTGPCTVTYTMAGQDRVLNCTIKESLIPAENFPYDRTAVEGANVPDVRSLMVWNLDKNRWQSFRMDRVTSVTEITE